MPDLTTDALVPFGWSERVLALYTSCADGECTPARVTRVERSGCVAVGPDGEERLLRAEPLPAVGDWLAVADGAVRHVLPRWSALQRADPDGSGTQTLAANIDLVLVTTPADRSSAARVERELALAWDSGAVPLVVVAKSDLDADAAAASLESRLPGTDVLAVSAVTGGGVAELQARLAPDRTAVLLGPSGAGKSTLANALLGEERLATAAVREGDHRGRHTTTSRQLVAVPGGGVLIDTPGLRSLGLTAGLDIGAGFPDIETLARQCRFADCAHDGEPGCAVEDAITSGELDPARLESFRKLTREVAWERRRRDPVAGAAERQAWKARSREYRARDRARGKGRQ
ncbi:MAG TPA: ribosome small subunit-dependent GTPase A [Solirubrobacteraceae bacterium]